MNAVDFRVSSDLRYILLILDIKKVISDLFIQVSVKIALFNTSVINNHVLLTKWLIVWSIFVIEKLILAHLVKIFPRIYVCLHKRSTLDPILGQVNTVHVVPLR